MMRQRIGEALARQDARADLGHDRPQPADVDVGCQQLEPVVEARAGLEQQRKVEREDRHVFGARGAAEGQGKARAAVPLSATDSIGTRPRYSMRRATSAAVGAEIDPLTTSPFCVSAR